MKYIARGNDAAGQRFADLFNQAMRDYDQNQQRWYAELRDNNIAGCHPDDGWVDRNNNTIAPAYPVIWMPLSAGSYFALGDHERYRIVRLIEYQPSIFDDDCKKYGRWLFEDIRPLPEPEKKRIFSRIKSWIMKNG